MELDRKSARTLILILSTFTYLLIGAAIFDHLESNEDNRVREEISHINERLQRKYNFTQKDMELFEAIVIKGIPQKSGYQWQFAGAFYFATLVITTVGYGHAAPETMCGRLFCMIFALAGIPMGLIMFQSIGERVNTFISFCLHKFKDLLHQQGFECLQEITPTHLLIVSLSIGTTVIILGTYTFHIMEKWSIFDSYYFCFITFTTIGFGDLVPLQRPGALQEQPFYTLFTYLYILIGLAVFSACVNLLVLRVMAPNADEVTASQREPGSSIVLERFVGAVDSQLFGAHKFSFIQPRKPQRSLSISVIDDPIYESNKLVQWKKLICSCRCRRKRSRPRKMRYSLTRQPTRNINRLVDQQESIDR